MISTSFSLSALLTNTPVWHVTPSPTCNSERCVQRSAQAHQMKPQSSGGGEGWVISGSSETSRRIGIGMPWEKHHTGCFKMTNFVGFLFFKRLFFFGGKITCLIGNLLITCKQFIVQSTPHGIWIKFSGDSAFIVVRPENISFAPVLKMKYTGTHNSFTVNVLEPRKVEPEQDLLFPLPPLHVSHAYMDATLQHDCSVPTGHALTACSS